MTKFSITRRDAIAGLAATAAVPGSAAAQAGPKRGGTLRISHNTRIASLNVLQIANGGEYVAVDMLYSGLTRMGTDMRPKPDLALEWSGDAEAKNFIFKLRPGVTFHDGKPFKAEDVVATIKTIQDPKSASPARSVLNMIADVVALDDMTVKFILSSSYADLPISLAHANARIVSAEALKGPLTALDTKPFGTGPFKLDTFDSSRLLRVVRNPNYYAPEKPYLDAVELRLYPDLAAETQNFLSRANDVMAEVQQADYKRIASTPGVVGVRTASGRFINLVMRRDQKPFDDVRVRRALSMAIDRPTLVDMILEGYGRPASDNVISGDYRYLAETPMPKYDTAAARRLLAEAGYPNGIKLPLYSSNRPAIRSQVGIAVKEMAKPAGFDIDVQTMPHDTYVANVWMKANFYVGYWGMQSTEDQVFTLLFTSDAAFGDTAWNNKEFDALISKARAVLDDGERRKLYSEAQNLMVRDVPSVVPFFQDALTAHQSYVKNWVSHPLSRYFFIENVWLDGGH